MGGNRGWADPNHPLHRAAGGGPAHGKYVSLWPGHKLRRVHGANDPDTLAPMADELEAELPEVAPWCARPAFAPSVRAWAWAEASCECYRRWFSEKSFFDPETGEPRRGVEAWMRAERHAAAMRERLALDPTSFARLLNLAAGSEHAAEEREHLLIEARTILEARSVLPRAPEGPEEGQP